MSDHLKHHYRLTRSVEDSVAVLVLEGFDLFGRLSEKVKRFIQHTTRALAMNTYDLSAVKVSQTDL